MLDTGAEPLAHLVEATDPAEQVLLGSHRNNRSDLRVPDRGLAVGAPKVIGVEVREEQPEIGRGNNRSHGFSSNSFDHQLVTSTSMNDVSAVLMVPAATDAFTVATATPLTPATRALAALGQ
jgi:hypothetical protein